MTDEPTAQLRGTIDKLTAEVKAATTAAGAAAISRDARITSETVVRLARGDRAPFDEDRSLVPRLMAWWIRRASTGAPRVEELPLLPFDHLQDFWLNFYDGPPQHDRRRFWGLQMPRRRARLLGHEVNFPFGVPACALTPNASYIEYFAERGFDVLTYKTVRDRPWNPHPYPQWAFAVDPGELDPDHLDTPVLASLRPATSELRSASLVNSFGVPSLPVAAWQEDVETCRRLLRPGQLLIVSVMGSPEEGRTGSALVRDFASVSRMARDAGAQVVELNLSCPNSKNDSSLVCQNPDASADVVQAVAAELDRTETPLVIKISYLSEAGLRDLVQACARYVDGIVAINTVLVPVVDSQGRDFFPDRPKAGLSGPAIRHLGLETVRQLVALREKNGYEYSVLGVGGVTSPTDFDAYIDAGADGVQSCSGAWLNPLLAYEIRRRELDPLGGVSEDALDQAVKSLQLGLETALLARDDVPGYIKTRLARNIGD